MSKQNDGGPAFPMTPDDTGMSLRAYLAGKALSGVISTSYPGSTNAAIADVCVGLADDLIAALDTPA